MLDLSVLCATAVVVVVAVVVNVGRLSVVPERAPTSAQANLASGNDNHQTKQLDPNVAVLSARELPGYKLISSAEALRAGGGTVPNSRDNLFQRSEAGSPDYAYEVMLAMARSSSCDNPKNSKPMACASSPLERVKLVPRRTTMRPRSPPRMYRSRRSRHQIG